MHKEQRRASVKLASASRSGYGIIISFFSVCVAGGKSHHHLSERAVQRHNAWQLKCPSQ